MAFITWEDTVSDGVQTDYNIIFPFLDRDHVVISFNGATQAPSLYSFLSDTQIRLNTAATSGVTVSVGRKTPQTVLTDFPSSIVTEDDLDGGYLQNLYVLQELQDEFDDSVASAITVASDLLLLNSLTLGNNDRLQWIDSAGSSSLNGVRLNTIDDLLFQVPNETNTFAFAFANNFDLLFQFENDGPGILIREVSSSDHSAPGTNDCIIYTKDVGGKTALFARFNTGAVQQIAIEP